MEQPEQNQTATYPIQTKMCSPDPMALRGFFAISYCSKKILLHAKESRDPKQVDMKSSSG